MDSQNSVTKTFTQSAMFYETQNLSKIALIVSVSDFPPDSNYPPRPMANADSKLVEAAMVRLGFACTIVNRRVLPEQVATKIRDLLRKPSKVGMFVLMVSSHATQNEKEFVFSDGSTRRLADFQHEITKNTGMDGKPKIFFCEYTRAEYDCVHNTIAHLEPEVDNVDFGTVKHNKMPKSSKARPHKLVDTAELWVSCPESGSKGRLDH